MKNIGNYRKYDIFFDFRFTKNIFPSIAENPENMIFTLSVFSKMLFFSSVDQYKYSGYGISFDRHGTSSFPTGGFGCNVTIFGVLLISNEFFCIC